LEIKPRWRLLLALAQEAEVLILDEPTAGLDPVMVDEILRTLIEDHVSQGRTILCRATIWEKWNRFATGSESWKKAAAS